MSTVYNQVMKNEISYEWTFETIEDGDIADVDFNEKLDDLKTDDDGQLGLVRRVGNEADGEISRAYAYVKDGVLPETFIDLDGSDTGIKVPKRFIEELKKNNLKNN